MDYYGSYYGNNDYRDYIAHFRTPGALNKVHNYLKKIGEGANARYVYARDKVADWGSKNVTGSYYKRQASEAIRDYAKGSANKMSSPEYNKRRRESMTTKVNNARAGYKKSIAGRLETARGHLTNLKYKAKNKIGGLIERGKRLVSDIKHRIKKRLGMYEDNRSDASSYGRTKTPSTKKQLEVKLNRNKKKSAKTKRKIGNAATYTY